MRRSARSPADPGKSGSAPAALLVHSYDVSSQHPLFLFVLPGTPAVLATDEQEQEQEQEHEEEQEEDAPLCNYFSTKRCNADRF